MGMGSSNVHVDPLYSSSSIAYRDPNRVLNELTEALSASRRTPTRPQSSVENGVPAGLVPRQGSRGQYECAVLKVAGSQNLQVRQIPPATRTPMRITSTYTRGKHNLFLLRPSTFRILLDFAWHPNIWGRFLKLFTIWIVFTVRPYCGYWWSLDLLAGS